MKLENVPDGTINPSWDGSCTATYLYEHSRYCLRNLGHLHDWLRYLDDASRVNVNF